MFMTLFYGTVFTFLESKIYLMLVFSSLPKNRLVSSSDLKTLSSPIIKNKSLIKTLNNSGPRIHPCDTVSCISCYELLIFLFFCSFSDCVSALPALPYFGIPRSREGRGVDPRHLKPEYLLNH